MTNIVETRGLTVRYGPTAVLDDVTFAVPEGEYLAIVGPNGSGKTTLIKALLGLLPVSAGEIMLLGQDVGSFCKWDDVGYLPQVSRALHAGFPATVREVVGMGLLSGKRFPKRLGGKDWAIVDETLELLQITQLKNRMIGRLSGGQQQRVLLARAMLSDPKLLILDEPTVALDPETRSRFYETIGSLNKTKGTTVILITHDTGTVGHVATTFLYLNRKIVFHGSFEAFCHSGEMADYFGDEQHLICHQH